MWIKFTKSFYYYLHKINISILRTSVSSAQWYQFLSGTIGVENSCNRDSFKEKAEEISSGTSNYSINTYVFRRSFEEVNGWGIS